MDLTVSDRRSLVAVEGQLHRSLIPTTIHRLPGSACGKPEAHRGGNVILPLLPKPAQGVPVARSIQATDAAFGQLACTV